MYDSQSFQVPNPLDRFALGDRDKLTTNPDGSLDIYFGGASPGPARRRTGCRRRRTGRSRLTMRLYSPRQEALSGAGAAADPRDRLNPGSALLVGRQIPRQRRRQPGAVDPRRGDPRPRRRRHQRRGIELRQRPRPAPARRAGARPAAPSPAAAAGRARARDRGRRRSRSPRAAPSAISRFGFFAVRSTFCTTASARAIASSSAPDRRPASSSGAHRPRPRAGRRSPRFQP